MSKNYYEILDLQRTATNEQIASFPKKQSNIKDVPLQVNEVQSINQNSSKRSSSKRQKSSKQKTNLDQEKNQEQILQEQFAYYNQMNADKQSQNKYFSSDFKSCSPDKVNSQVIPSELSTNPLRQTCQNLPSSQQYLILQPKNSDSISKSSATSSTLQPSGNQQQLSYTINNQNHLKKQLLHIIPSQNSANSKAIGIYNAQSTPKNKNVILQESLQNTAISQQQSQQNIQPKTSIFNFTQQQQMNSTDAIQTQLTSQRILVNQHQQLMKVQNKKQQQDQNIIFNNSGQGSKNNTIGQQTNIAKNKKLSLGSIDLKLATAVTATGPTTSQTTKNNQNNSNQFFKKESNNFVQIYGQQQQIELNKQTSPPNQKRRNQQITNIKSQKTQERIQQMIDHMESPQRQDQLLQQQQFLQDTTNSISQISKEEVQYITNMNKNQSLSPKVQALQKQLLRNQQIIQAQLVQQMKQGGTNQNNGGGTCGKSTMITSGIGSNAGEVIGGGNNSNCGIMGSVNSNTIDDKHQRKGSFKGKILKKNFSLSNNQIKSPQHAPQGSFNGTNIANFCTNSNYQKYIPNTMKQKMNFSYLLQNLNQTQDGRLPQNFLMNNKQQQQQQQLTHQKQQENKTNQSNSRQNKIKLFSSQNEIHNDDCYYQISNSKSKQNTERKVQVNFKVGVGAGSSAVVQSTSLSRRDINQTNMNSKKQSSLKKPKRRSSTQVKGSFALSQEIPQHNDSQQSQLQQQQLQLQQQLQTFSTISPIKEVKKETVDEGTDIQTSFIQEKSQNLQKLAIHYKLKIKQLPKIVTDDQSNLDDEELLIGNQSCYNLIREFLNQEQLIQESEGMKSVKEAFYEMFQYQNNLIQSYADQVTHYKQQKQTQQNISPSAYEILKTDYDKLQKENQVTKEKLKLSQEFNQSFRQQIESVKKKLKEKEQVIVMLQDTFEKELNNCYSEYEVKKIARELTVLYEQNQELHKMNKKMKNELRIAQEREIQFIKIIQKSPELMKALELDDSSIIEQKQQKIAQQNQEVAIVSSKKVPINKLDLDKVTEIQKLQAQGQLPPLEESLIINKREMKDQVKDMILDGVEQQFLNRSEQEIDERKQYVKQTMNDILESFTKYDGRKDDEEDQEEEDDDSLGYYDEDEEDCFDQIGAIQSK